MNAATAHHTLVQPHIDDTSTQSVGTSAELHYGWWERLAQLRDRPLLTATYNQAEAAFASAEHFISHWAGQAERLGCQPVHLLRPPSALGVDDGGLAWRWEGVLEAVGVSEGQVFAAGPEGLAKVYRLLPDGGVSMVRALPRSEVAERSVSVGEFR